MPENVEQVAPGLPNAALQKTIAELIVAWTENSIQSYLALRRLGGDPPANPANVKAAITKVRAALKPFVLHIIEELAHFYLRAEMGKHSGTRKPNEIDEDYRAAAALAAMAAPYRHARLSAVKLAGEPNDPMRVWDNATADELRAEVLRHARATRGPNPGCRSGIWT